MNWGALVAGQKGVGNPGSAPAVKSPQDHRPQPLAILPKTTKSNIKGPLLPSEPIVHKYIYIYICIHICTVLRIHIYAYT